MDYSKLRTIRQIATPAMSEAAIRSYIQEARSNGLDNAIVRMGRRIYLDVDEFNAWLDARRMVA
ncbi:MAG: DNA-binding protein [Betaproteobacteria bacterium]|nr:DNA-binding protein [Betaproteobacteria bacterium]